MQLMDLNRRKQRAFSIQHSAFSRLGLVHGSQNFPRETTCQVLPLGS